MRLYSRPTKHRISEANTSNPAHPPCFRCSTVHSLPVDSVAESRCYASNAQVEPFRKRLLLCVMIIAVSCGGTPVPVLQSVFSQPFIAAPAFLLTQLLALLYQPQSLVSGRSTRLSFVTPSAQSELSERILELEPEIHRLEFTTELSPLLRATWKRSYEYPRTCSFPLTRLVTVFRGGKHGYPERQRKTEIKAKQQVKVGPHVFARRQTRFGSLKIPFALAITRYRLHPSMARPNRRAFRRQETRRYENG